MKAVKVLLALSLVAVLFLPGLALADGVFIPDTTQVDPYRWNAESTYPGWTTWTDVIGTPTANWDLKGVNIAFTADKVQMTIYTNYAQGGISENGVNAGQADIALGQNGVFNYGIKMSGDDLGKVYAVTAWTKSSDNALPWNNGNWIYAGKYDQGDPKDPLVLIAAGTVIGAANVSWDSGGAIATNAISVIFDRSLLGDNFDFQLGSGTCANDWMAGGAEVSSVPLPGSILLLGSGLLGLLGRRKVTGLKA